MLAIRRQNYNSYGQRGWMLHLEPARLPLRQPQAPELLLFPRKGVLSQPAKPGHGIAGHQWLTKPVTAPACQTLSDRGTAEKKQEAWRGEKGKKKKEKKLGRKKGKNKRKAKRCKVKQWQWEGLLCGWGCSQGWRRAQGLTAPPGG